MGDGERAARMGRPHAGAGHAGGGAAEEDACLPLKRPPRARQADKPSKHPASQLASVLMPECAHALLGSGCRLSLLCGASTNQKTSGSSRVRGRANHLVKKQNVEF